MIRTFVILLAVASPNLACIGGLFGGGSGGCCSAAAPSCSSPCGGAPPPIPNVQSGGAYVTAPAVPFQSAPVLPFAAPPPAQLPTNAYAFPAPVQQNLNFPQVGGQSNLGYANGGVIGAQLQQQPAFVPQQPQGGYISPGNTQPQTVYSPTSDVTATHGGNVYELPTSQVQVVQPSGAYSVPEAGSNVVIPSTGVQGNVQTVHVPTEQPAQIDYKGVLGNNKESKIRGKNGHQGKYDEEGGASYDDFDGYNPSDLNGVASRPEGKVSVPAAPAQPRSQVTIITQQVRPSEVPIVTGPTEVIPSTVVHTVAQPISTGSVAPQPTINVAPSSTTVLRPSANVGTPVVTPKFTAPLTGPTTVNESTDVEQNQANTGTGAVRPTAERIPVATHVEQPHPTQAAVEPQNGGLDFHSINHQVAPTAAPQTKPIEPFAPQSKVESTEELIGDDYDALDEDRPEVPVAPTFTNTKEEIAEHQPTVEHISSAEQPASPSTVSTTNTEVPSMSPSSTQVQIKTAEAIDVAEGFDYGDGNGANYDDVAEDGKTTSPSDSKDYQIEPYAGIKKTVAGTIQLENAEPIDVDRIYMWKAKQ